MTLPVTDDYGNLVDRRSAHGARVAYDPRISLNTIVVCITVVGSLLAFTDRLSANAAQQAVQQNKQLVLEQQIKSLNDQRFIDRQEILLEIREMRKDIKDIGPRK